MSVLQNWCLFFLKIAPHISRSKWCYAGVDSGTLVAFTSQGLTAELPIAANLVVVVNAD